MKKNVFMTAVLAVSFLFAVPAEAQIKFGVKAGLNVNSVSLSNLGSNFSTDNRTGFFAGLQADVTVPFLGFGCDIAVLYNNKVSQYAYATTDEGGNTVGAVGNTTLQYIDIPFNIRYNLGLSSAASLYLATGPQFSFNISGKSVQAAIDDTSWKFKDSEFSWNFGAGVTFLSHYRVGYNFNLACGKTAEINYKDAANQLVQGKLKNNTHQISLMYIF
ncbi:MAG: porin family protein [Bacteroidaceae bacterium]|nr:porin family protein [Bacteroidaceae bacterium]